MTDIQKQKHLEQTRLDWIQHAMEGTIRSSGQLKELMDEKMKKQVSLPSRTEMVKDLHRVEKAMYTNMSFIARWFVELIKEIRPRTEMDKLFVEMDRKGLPE